MKPVAHTDRLYILIDGLQRTVLAKEDFQIQCLRRHPGSV